MDSIDRDKDSALYPRLLRHKGGLSRVEKERILEKVLADVDRSPPTARRWFTVSLAGVAAVAAAVAVGWWATGRGWRGQEQAGAPEFAVKGGAEPGFRAYCLGDRGPAPCARGLRLLIDLTVTDALPHFAAFARGHEGTIVWYFPEREDARSPVAKSGLFTEGILLGDEHAPGTYTIVGVFSQEALTRARVRALFTGAAPSTLAVRVVTKELFVE